MGILDEISKQDEPKEYVPLTYESLKKVIEEAFFKEEKKSKTSPISPIMLYTGLLGYYIFQLHMAGVGVPQGYYTFTTYKKSRLIILNLGIKCGMYKAIINLGKPSEVRVEIRKGTEVLKTGMSFDELVQFLGTLPIDQEYFLSKKKGVKHYIK